MNDIVSTERAATNFEKSISNSVGKKNRFKYDDKYWNLFPLDEYRIGFSEAKLEDRKINARDAFWIKPDAIFVDCVNSPSNAIVIEHCGSWNNFYQKRFVYDQDRLSFFKKLEEKNSSNKTMYEIKSKLSLTKILYILPCDTFSIRIISIGPHIETEMYLFCYDYFRNFVRDISPQDLLDFSVTRQEVIAEWSKPKQGDPKSWERCPPCFKGCTRLVPSDRSTSAPSIGGEDAAPPPPPAA